MTIVTRRDLIAAGLGTLLTTAARPVLADARVRIKLATLAPRGSAYHRVLQQMGEAFRAAEGPDSAFTIYTDGTQGGEADVVRRMRIGQLNAAMMSVIGLSEIDPTVSALQKLPMLYRSCEEVDYVGQALHPELESRILAKGFVIVMWAQAGWVRFFAKDPALTPQELKSRRLFAWSGDEEQIEIAKRLGYHPVSLETADIVPGLETGLIDLVAVTPLWALATQVDRLAPYMIDVKWAPIVGALVITRSAWDDMTPAARAALSHAAIGATRELHDYQIRADDEAIAAMEKRGLKVQRISGEQLATWEHFAQQVYPMLRGRTIPAPTFDEVMRLIAEYRALGKPS